MIAGKNSCSEAFQQVDSSTCWLFSGLDRQYGRLSNMSAHKFNRIALMHSSEGDHAECSARVVVGMAVAATVHGAAKRAAAA